MAATATPYPAALPEAINSDSKPVTRSDPTFSSQSCTSRQGIAGIGTLATHPHLGAHARPLGSDPGTAPSEP
jgi:hypothetical protein